MTWLVTSNAHAQADAPEDRVLELYRKGREARDRGNPREALEHLLKAWQLRKTHDVAASLAQVEHELGKVRDAAEHLAWAVNHFPAEVDPERARRVRDALERTRKEVVALQITVEPDAAEVFVNGRSLGLGRTLEKEVFADPGTIRISATLDGHEAWSSTLKAQAGEAHTVNGRLVAKANAAASPSATEMSPSSPYAPAAGDTNRAEKSFEWWPAIVGGGLTLAAVGIGVGFKLDADSAGKDADRSIDRVRAEFGGGVCATSGSEADHLCAVLRESRNQQANSNQVSNIAFVAAIGIAAATVGVQTFFLMSDRTQQQALKLTPIIGSDSAGLIVSRRF
jgi:hypothetical protein